MAEYITKENALAKLEKCARDPYHDTHYIRAAVINTIKRMAAADVVEVVRCKDCRWRNTIGCDAFVAAQSVYACEDDGFCKWAEREDND